MLFIGIDWSRDKHDFAILDPEGRLRARGQVPHARGGLDQLAQTIAAHESSPAQVRVVVELHDGALLAWLLEQGYTVYGLNPKSADRARDCYRPGGTKDDALDARILADWGRLHYATWRPVQAEGPATLSLRSWVRLRARLVQDKTCACQRLRALLDEWAPTLSTLCDDFNRQWQQALLQRCPLPEDLEAWHLNGLRGWARQLHLRAESLARIDRTRSQPAIPIPPARRDALRFEIRLLAEEIARLCQAISHAEQELDRLLQTHPDAFIFKSLPVKGTATVATLLAAFGEDRGQDISWRERAARWGVAPVTVQSGKSRHVKRRCACDTTYNQAFLFFAFKTAFTPGCWATDYYQAKRNAGVDHYSTLRALALRWVKILYRLWHDHLTYNEQLHQANRRLRGAAA